MLLAEVEVGGGGCRIAPPHGLVGERPVGVVTVPVAAARKSQPGLDAIAAGEPGIRVDHRQPPVGQPIAVGRDVAGGRRGIVLVFGLGQPAAHRHLPAGDVQTGAKVRRDAGIAVVRGAALGGIGAVAGHVTDR